MKRRRDAGAEEDPSRKKAKTASKVPPETKKECSEVVTPVNNQAHQNGLSPDRYREVSNVPNKAKLAAAGKISCDYIVWIESKFISTVWHNSSRIDQQRTLLVERVNPSKFNKRQASQLFPKQSQCFAQFLLLSLVLAQGWCDGNVASIDNGLARVSPGDTRRHSSVSCMVL